MRFLGCTLWTDFLLPDGAGRTDVELSMRLASQRMNDYRSISVLAADVLRHF